MKILLIGCGNLGTALLHALLKHTELDEVVVVQPSLSRSSEFSLHQNVKFIASAAQLSSNFKPSYIILAIKPQNLSNVIGHYKMGEAILISLLAGTSVATLQAYVGVSKKIVRLMPNLAMKFGESVNLAYLNYESLPYLGDIKKLLSYAGNLIPLANEEMIEALTPLSASGPAFFLLLTELIKTLAINAGLEKKLAAELAQQTLVGSAHLAATNADFNQLIAGVASKGGVTEAALNILNPTLPKLFQKAYNAAIERGKSLVQLSN